MNNSQQSIHDHPEPFQSMPLQPHLLPSEEHKVSIHIKPIQNFPSRDIFVTNNLRHSKRISMQQETPHLPSPSEKNKSFSDIISPQKIHTVVNLSLEKELDKHVHKSLNTMSEHSNIFEQSSIHKDENHKAATPSGFDLKEHDSLLNVDVVGEINSLPNKRACILCHNAPIVQTTITGSKLSTTTESNWEYDLIYPCLCNIKAHRECLKTYLLLRKIVACERCKTSYAVSGKTMREAGVSEKNRLRMITILLICIAIIAGGIVVIGILFSGSHPPVGVVGIVMVVIGILGIAYLVWKKYFSNKIVDIAVHCKQTEIARHRENPELTLKKFIAQEEKRRNSRVLKKAHKVIGLLDPVEFENFIKMVTPRTEKQEKMPNHERNGSVNFLLSEKKDHEDEENKLKARKEIFIAPTEVEKSENTMPDNPSNINEYSAKLRSNAIPQIRVTDSHPSKHVATYIRREPPRPLRPDMRRELSRGSQSERRYTDTGRRLQSARLVKPSFRDPLSAASIGGTHGFTTRDRVDSPYLPVDGLRKQTEEEPKSRD